MRKRIFITASFLERIQREGSLARAVERSTTSVLVHEPLPRMSTWALVCEEVVDTTYDDAYYERVVTELFRRGISRAELEQMRIFAWETAGWLNFEQMLWNWCSLDEADIRRAIRWQLKEQEIDDAEAEIGIAYLERYLTERHCIPADYRRLDGSGGTAGGGVVPGPPGHR